MRTPLLAALVVVLAVAVPAAADECVVTTQRAFDTNPDGTPLVPRHYVQTACFMDEFCLWIYEESNGIEGLQRGGSVCNPAYCWDDEVDDTCGGRVAPDTLVF